MAEQKTPLEQLLENAHDLQRGFAYAISAASGDKPGIYREIKKAIDLSTQVIESQMALDARLAKVEKLLPGNDQGSEFPFMKK